MINFSHPLLARIVNRSVHDPITGCWTWCGQLTAKGYGKITIGGHGYRVHRLTYELVNGQIPEDLQIDHLCRNRACWYPQHLEAVTARENILRGYAPSALNARKTHCPQGHEYTPENTRIKQGSRECRECRRLQRAAARAVKGPYIPQARKTHCTQGHEMTPENTVTKGKKRRCRICLNASHRVAYRRKNPNPRPRGRPRKEAP